MRVIHTTPRKINIIGIDDHELTGLNEVTAAALLDTQKGPIIGVFHEYAHLGKGRSIHAAGQMEWFMLIPNRDSPNGYSAVIPAELQSVTFVTLS